MAYSKLDVLLLLLRGKRVLLNEADKAHIFSVLHHSQVLHGCAQSCFTYRKKWIMLSLTPASHSWKNDVTVSIRLARQLCVKHPFMWKSRYQHRAWKQNTYMCVKCLRGSNIRRCMFSISIPSTLLEYKKNITHHMSATESKHIIK